MSKSNNFEVKNAYVRGFADALARSQVLHILAPTVAYLRSVIPPMFSKNIFPSYPWRISDIDQTEFFSSKVWALDLLRELSLRIVKFLARSVLLFYALCLEKTMPSWNYRLRRVVDPQAHMCALEWIGGEEVRFITGISLLEELAQDE
jgi:hypothetical protein